MSFQEHLKKVMITYPSLFPTATHVYDHLFMVIGNGYEWINGELVYDDEESLCKTTEEAINKAITDKLNLIKEIFVIHKRSEETFNNIVNRYARDLQTNIHNILCIEDKMYYLRIPDNCDIEGETSEIDEFRFYDLSHYSAIANIPDNVKFDWIDAIKNFVDFLENNKDKFTDKENLFEGIKERVNKLYNDRVTKYTEIIR